MSINEKIKLNNSNWYWPVNDENNVNWNGICEYWNTPQKIMQYVNNFNTCVSAGGNCGVYIKQFAQKFKRVYTFEPEFINFLCLNLNVIESNVYKFQSFLGNEHKLMDIELSSNPGGHNLGAHPKLGNIPMLKIDDLNLDSCDLIQLDVEGAEIIALQGALETIHKYKPTIVVEIAWSDATCFLNTLGYSKITKEDNDWIFLPSHE